MQAPWGCVCYATGEREGRRACLECVGGGDSGEALGVVGGGADAVQAVLGVVDGEDHLGPPEAVVVVAVPVGLRDASRAPVVAVQDVRLPPRLQQKLQRRLHALPTTAVTVAIPSAKAAVHAV